MQAPDAQNGPNLPSKVLKTCRNFELMDVSGVSPHIQAQQLAASRDLKIESLRHLMLKKALESQKQQTGEIENGTEGKGRLLDIRV